MRKFFKKIHLWLSIPVGLIITLICLTGAILIFENEINEMRQPSLYKAEPKGEALPLSTLIERVEQSYFVDVAGVTINHNQNRSYQFSLSRPKRTTVFVDQYSGKILGEQERLEFFSTVLKLHRFLLQKRPEGKDSIFWGKKLVGISTILLVFIVITGFIIWLPKSKNNIANRLKIRFKKGWRCFWYDLHVSGGFYVTLIVLAIALTGLTWSFPWYKDAFYKIFSTSEQGSGNRNRGGGSGRGSGNFSQILDADSRYISWDNAVKTLQKSTPEFVEMRVSEGNVRVKTKKCGNYSASDSYDFDKNSGEIIGAELYKDLPRNSKIRGWVYSVHVGAWGGMPMRIIYFIAVIIAASLPLTGYYLWLRKKVRKKKTAVSCDCCEVNQ